MRYFLHLVQENQTVVDHEGSLHPTIDSALAEAIDSARELMATAVREGHDVSDWFIDVSDESGKLVDRVVFSSVISKPERPLPSNIDRTTFDERDGTSKAGSPSR